MTVVTTYFDSALAYLFHDEGSVYTDDPQDRGGPTKWGVTQATYSQFVGRKVTPEEIAALTIEDVKPFYQMMFWEVLHCNQLRDPGIAIGLFDSGVLYGPAPVALLAQGALALCGAEFSVDGIIGVLTLELLNTVPRAKFLAAFVKLLLHRIDVVIANHPQDEKYRKGWTNRAERLLTLNTVTTFNIKTTL